ncbi:MAG: DUF2182 domain-containing protein [Hyphomicrobiaceae bacterium]
MTRHLKDAHWLLFFLAILAGWAGLLLHGASQSLPPAPLGAYLGWFDWTGEGSLWRSLCSASAATAEPISLIAMWALMSLGMMLPTAYPMLATFSELMAARPMGERFWNFAMLLAGYASVWLGFSVPAGLLQLGLTRQGLVGVDGTSLSAALSAIVLLAAGLYQFSAIKHACVSKCRSPMTTFLAGWRDGAAGAYLMGIRNGIHCLGCCAALMLLAFVGGTMNLAFMGLAMVLMAVEKLPGPGRHVTRPLGIALVGAGAVVAASALGFA